MDQTTSYADVFPPETLARYQWAETRNASAILRTTNPTQFDDLIDVLDGFAVDEDLDIREAGGNESKTANRLNRAFRDLGWREGSYNVEIHSALTVKPYAPAGEKAAIRKTQITEAPSYLVDNLHARVALDVEWHAKDGNLDRDIAAYRSLYDAGIIDVGVMITQYRTEMRQWALDLLGPTLPNGEENKKFKTTTSTCLEKVVPRITRGDGGGCPILIIAIGAATT